MSAAQQGPKDRAPSRVGQVLRGKWRLDELLAVGGMASVYAATHRNGKRGAVKLLHYELSLNEESRTRFLREGYVANKVDHEGAVSVLDDDICDDGTVFLVMELLEGHTIDALLRARNTRTFALGETLRVTDRLLDVLAAAHEKGVVHRDIKPENVFITKQGKLKVLDFGIARLREAAAGAGVTRAGDLLGTPSFMSPEQALGNMDMVDGRSDIWSVGATMFRLITGRPVHNADSVNRVLLAAMTMPAPPIGRVLPGVPPPLAAIVDRALAFEQNSRWPDTRSMRAAVRSFAEAMSLRMEGPVLDTVEEARARHATLPLDTPAPQQRAPAPLPAAGRPAYTPPAQGVHTPPSQHAYTPPAQGVHMPPSQHAPTVPPPGGPAAPVPFAPSPPPPAAPSFAAPPPPVAADTGMSMSALMADADDGESDALTNVRETVPFVTGSTFGATGQAPAAPQTPAPTSEPRAPTFGPSPGAPPPAAASPTPSFGLPSGERPTVAISQTPSVHSAVSQTPSFGGAVSQTPSFGGAASQTPSFNGAASQTPSYGAGAPGDRPITLAPSLTPSFLTASPVSRDPTFGPAPRSTRVAPFVVLGAVAVLGGLAAIVLVGSRSGSASADASAPAAVTASAAPTSTPTAPAATDTPPPATAEPPPPPPATAEPTAQPPATTPPAPSATPAKTAAPSAKPTSAPTSKPTATSTPSRPPKGDPFSSRKW